MTVIGNLFLIGAALIFFGLCSVLFSRQSPPSGDYAVGYAWTLILGNLGFMICMAVLTGIIGAKGGFSWVGSPGTPRFLIVCAGFALAMIGFGFFAMREGMSLLPAPVRQFLHYVPALQALLLLLCAAVLLNDGEQSAAPAAFYRWSLLFTVVLGLFALGLIMVRNAQNATARITEESNFEKRNHQNHLDQIDSTDVMQGLVTLLVFTDANHAQDVRERALAKIKSHPDWQGELARRLENGWAPQVFTFLASNEVEDKAMLLEPVRQGVLVQAGLFRESIRKSRDHYDLYSGLFIWEVERVLRTVQKFENQGVDYLPAVQELRNALDEPTRFTKPKLHCAAVLDKWLRQHSSKSQH